MNIKYTQIFNFLKKYQIIDSLYFEYFLCVYNSP